MATSLDGRKLTVNESASRVISGTIEAVTSGCGIMSAAAVYSSVAGMKSYNQQVNAEGGTAGKTSYAQSSNNSEKAKGWKVGEPIDNLTRAGNEPSWNTVKSRYWKNEAYYNAELYTESDLELMKKGKAPVYPEIGVPKELHHIYGRQIENPHNQQNLMQVWPWEHSEIDPHRFYTGPRPEGN